jgi:hypothetical protein
MREHFRSVKAVSDAMAALTPRSALTASSAAESREADR